MHFTNIRIVFATVFIINFSYSTAQQTNLLQRYIKQYFQDYFPSTVRSYTLYGNGQSGAADFHGGLPFSYDTSGKVKSLIYSTASNSPSQPPSKASSKNSGVVVENAWVYPGLTNTFQPLVMDPQMIQPYPHQFHQRSDPAYISGPQFQVVQQPEQNLNLPLALPAFSEIDDNVEQLAESRMVEVQEPVVELEPYYNNPEDDNYTREISLQSTMSF